MFQATAKRQFAAQAVAKTERELVKAEPLKVSTLSNGLTVASLENHSPVATIGVVIKVIGLYRVYHNNSHFSTYTNKVNSQPITVPISLIKKNYSVSQT